jgi:ribosomal protein L37AE/L43A
VSRLLCERCRRELPSVRRHYSDELGRWLCLKCAAEFTQQGGKVKPPVLLGGQGRSVESVSKTGIALLWILALGACFVLAALLWWLIF